jgi:hypothetical protein
MTAITNTISGIVSKRLYWALDSSLSFFYLAECPRAESGSADNKVNRVCWEAVHVKPMRVWNIGVGWELRSGRDVNRLGESNRLAEAASDGD